MSPCLYSRLMREKLARVRQRAGDAAGMHTEHHIDGPGSVEPEALDVHVAKLHRDMAGEDPRPADPLSEASDYQPNCVHGMNSFADGRYDLALARLRRG